MNNVHIKCIVSVILIIFFHNGISVSDEAFPRPLRLAVEGQIKTIDPSLTFDTSSIELTEQLFLGLTNYTYKNSSYQVVPELSSQWTIHNNGTVYHFQLRKDIYWVKGISCQKIRPVTAHDVVWAIHRNIDPKTDTPYASALYILKNGQDIHQKKNKNIKEIGVRALNDHLVEFELEYAASYFPAMTTMWIYRPLPKEIVKLHGNKWTKPENIYTNGAYTLSQWQKRRKMVLKKNKHFITDNSEQISEIHYYIIPESFAGLNMYLKNRLDIIGGNYTRFSPVGIFRINRDQSLKLEHLQATRFNVYSYHFNAIRPPVDNVLVRKAITAAVDRALLVEVITKGGERPASTFTHPSFLGKKDDTAYLDEHFDPVQALNYLAEAGYPNGENFPKIILCYDISDTHHIIAKSFQIMLKHFLNIDVVLDPKEWGDFIEAIDNKDKNNVPHLFRFGWMPDYLDANNFLNEALSHSRSFSGWNDEKFDSLLNKARLESDLDKRLGFYQLAEKILTTEQVAIVPLYFEVDHYLVKPWIKNFFPIPIGGQHIEEWSFSE